MRSLRRVLGLLVLLGGLGLTGCSLLPSEGEVRARETAAAARVLAYQTREAAKSAKLQAKAEREQAKADLAKQRANQAALETEKRQMMLAAAAAQGKALGWVGVALAVILALGGLVIVYRKANQPVTIRPDEAGLYPLLILRRGPLGLGGIVYLDPGRALGPGGELTRRGYTELASGYAPQLLADVARQQQAVQALAATTRGETQPTVEERKSMQELARQAFAERLGGLPEVKLLDDVSAKKLLIQAGGQDGEPFDP